MTRRSCAVLLALLLPTACVAPGHERVEWSAAGFGASAEVHTTIAADAPALLDEIRAQLDRGIVLLDPDERGSEIGRLNAAPRGEFQRIDDLDVFRCLSLALAHARQSAGAYDLTFGALAPPGGATTPTLSVFEYERRVDDAGWRHVTLERDLRSIRLPDSTLALDLGAVGRACALDWAARTFARPGARAGLLRVDRTLWAWRAPPGSDDWRIEVEDPREPTRALVTLRLANRALATAAPSDAILDPRTGARITTDVQAALAIADSAADAAALAHEIVAAGPLEAARALARTPGAEALLVVRDRESGTAYGLASASLEARIEASPALSTETANDLRFLLPPGPS